MTTFRIFRPRPQGLGLLADAMTAARIDFKDQAIRVPHHSVSVGPMRGDMVSSGSGKARNLKIVQGECILADGGVLVLDELPEFKREVIEVVARIYHREAARFMFASADCIVTVEVPTRFSVYATARLCPCGLIDKGCRCSKTAVQRFNARVRDFQDLLSVPRETRHE